MQATYRFRLKPNKQQLATLQKWQTICCYVTNRMLGDRERTYLMQKTLGDYCSLYDKKLYAVTSLRSNKDEKYIGSGLYCSVNRSVSLGYPWKTGDVKRARFSKKKSKKEPSLKRSAYEMQSSYLPELKKLKPEIAEVNAFVLQKQCDKVDKAFQKFFKGEAKYPKYKKPHEIGFEFEPKTVSVDLENNRITLSGIGSVRFFISREWWEGLSIRKTSVTYKGGNWYVNILVRDDLIPNPQVKSHEEVTTVIGGDMGIKKLLSLPGSATYDNPRFLERQQRRLAIRQRRVSRKKKGSNNLKKAAKRVGRLQFKIADKRDDYQWKIAKSFVKQADMNVLEDLKVSSMKKRCKPKKDEKTGKYLKNGQKAKSKLNKAISDASWYSLRQKIKHQSDKQGKLHVVVSPHHTSQKCSNCNHCAQGNREGEKFICEECGYYTDADNNAALNIANKGIEQERLSPNKVRVVSSEFTPKITVRSYHQPFGLMSRGIAKSKGYPEKRILRKVISSDSKPIALA